MTVSCRMGELIGPKIPTPGKRGTRERKIAKVIKSIGKGEWTIMDLSGNVETKTSNRLTIEHDIVFDEIAAAKKPVAKTQSFLDGMYRKIQSDDGKDDASLSNNGNLSSDDDYDHVSNVSSTATGYDSESTTVSLPTAKSDDEDEGETVWGVDIEYAEFCRPTKKFSHKTDAPTVKVSITKYSNAKSDWVKLNSKKTAAHEKKMNEAKEKMDALVGTEIVVDGHTDKNKKIKWVVVKEHVPKRMP